MNMEEESKKWIEKAEEDLDTARYNIKGNKINASLLFLQQSSEKALKAVYIKKFNKLLKVHDLVLLAKKVDAPEKIIEFCKELTPAYQYTRYPDVEMVNNPKTLVSKFLKFNEEILKWAKEKILSNK